MARTFKSIRLRCERIQAEGLQYLATTQKVSHNGINFIEVQDKNWRWLYDEALDLVHYSNSCQRVGRCMRLAIVEDGEWVGGIVLGSTFPNILVRDEVVGLRKFVTDYKERGLASPWSRENKSYWSNLQRVVNHARTFVFPQCQGRGIGIRAHRSLLTDGIKLWEHKYQEPVYALDTLCTADESKLFLLNGWTRAGQTKGYTLDRKNIFSKTLAVVDDRKQGIRNNGALCKGENSTEWWVWVIQLKEF